jgi:hypothetical protein
MEVRCKYDQIIYILSKFLHFVAWKLKFNQSKYIDLQLRVTLFINMMWISRQNMSKWLTTIMRILVSI